MRTDCVGRFSLGFGPSGFSAAFCRTQPLPAAVAALCSTLPLTAAHCRTPPHSAALGRSLQHSAALCRTPPSLSRPSAAPQQLSLYDARSLAEALCSWLLPLAAVPHGLWSQMASGRSLLASIVLVGDAQACCARF
jgi:hypothetical protein